VTCWYIILGVHFLLGQSELLQYSTRAIKPHIAHRVYKDNWVQDKHRQNTCRNKAKAGQRPK